MDFILDDKFVSVVSMTPLSLHQLETAFQAFGSVGPDPDSEFTGFDDRSKIQPQEGQVGNWQ